MEKQKNSFDKITDNLVIKLIAGVFIALIIILAIFLFEHREEKMDNEVIIAFLIHLITASLIALLTFAILKPLKRLKNESNIKEMAKLISDEVLKQNEDHKYKGLANVHLFLNHNIFSEKIKRAKKLIIFNIWIPEFYQLTKEIEKMLKAGNSAKILLLNPYSEIVHLRADALEKAGIRGDRIDVQGELDKNLQSLKIIFDSLNEENKKNLEVRIYNTFPSISFYACDDTHYVGFYFHSDIAVNSPQFEILSENSDLGDFFATEFNITWEMAKPIEDWSNFRAELKAQI